MPKTISTSVRILFASFVLTLLAYAGLDTALSRPTVGLSSCGDAANPCALPALTVSPDRSAGRLAEATPADLPAVRALVAPAVPAEPVPLAES